MSNNVTQQKVISILKKAGIKYASRSGWFRSSGVFVYNYASSHIEIRSHDSELSATVERMVSAAKALKAAGLKVSMHKSIPSKKISSENKTSHAEVYVVTDARLSFRAEDFIPFNEARFVAAFQPHIEELAKRKAAKERDIAKRNKQRIDEIKSNIDILREKNAGYSAESLPIGKNTDRFHLMDLQDQKLTAIVSWELYTFYSLEQNREIQGYRVTVTSFYDETPLNHHTRHINECMDVSDGIFEYLRGLR